MISESTARAFLAGLTIVLQFAADKDYPKSQSVGVCRAHRSNLQV